MMWSVKDEETGEGRAARMEINKGKVGTILEPTDIVFGTLPPVECPGCEEHCSQPVHVELTTNKRWVRLFIFCRTRDDTAFVYLTPEVFVR